MHSLFLQLTINPSECDAKRMKNARGFGVVGVVLVVLGLALIGGGTYVWYATTQATRGNQPTPTKLASVSPTPTPTPDPTAGWRTYTSPDHRYSLKYPPDWQIREFSAEQTNLTGSGATFSIKRGTLQLGPYDPASVREYPVQVDGQSVTAKEFDLAANQSASDYLIAFEADRHGRTYAFRLGGERGVNRERAQQTQRQMLATFRFVD